MARASLVDISQSDKTVNRSLLFAYLGSTFALSRSFSSALGGIIVGTAKNFYSNPYFIACAISAGLVGIALILSYYCLPETNKETESKVSIQLTFSFC